MWSKLYNIFLSLALHNSSFRVLQRRCMSRRRWWKHIFRPSEEIRYSYYAFSIRNYTIMIPNILHPTIQPAPKHSRNRSRYKSLETNWKQIFSKNLKSESFVGQLVVRHGELEALVEEALRVDPESQGARRLPAPLVHFRLQEQADMRLSCSVGGTASATAAATWRRRGRAAPVRQIGRLREVPCCRDQRLLLLLYCSYYNMSRKAKWVSIYL